MTQSPSSVVVRAGDALGAALTWLVAESPLVAMGVAKGVDGAKGGRPSAGVCRCDSTANLLSFFEDEDCSMGFRALAAETAAFKLEAVPRSVLAAGAASWKCETTRRNDTHEKRKQHKHATAELLSPTWVLLFNR